METSQNNNGHQPTFLRKDLNTPKSNSEQETQDDIYAELVANPFDYCKKAREYLHRHAEIPFSEVLKQLEVETRHSMNSATNAEEREFYATSFELAAGDLIGDYCDYGLLPEEEKDSYQNKVAMIYDSFFGGEKSKPVSDSEIDALAAKLRELSPGEIESFHRKFHEYEEQIAALENEYGGCVLGGYDYTPPNFNSYSDEERELFFESQQQVEEVIKQTIENLSDGELSALRREYIERSYEFGGEEFSGLHFGIEQNSFDPMYYLVNDGDDFYESDEFKYASLKQKQSIQKEIAEMTPEELHDMRQRQLDDLRDYGSGFYLVLDENGNYNVNNRIKNEKLQLMWLYDPGWEFSDEGRQFEQQRSQDLAKDLNEAWAKLVAKYPLVFDPSSVNDEEFKEFAKGYVKVAGEAMPKIPYRTIRKIEKLNKKGQYMEADRVAVNLFVKIFNFKSAPTIKYLDKYSNNRGDYNYNSDTLELKRNFDASDDMARMFRTIAHEMWHRHQCSEIERGTERGKLYEINYKNYQNYEPIDDSDLDDGSYFHYRSQILEYEADSFGVLTEELYRKITERKQRKQRIRKWFGS